MRNIITILILLNSLLCFGQNLNISKADTISVEQGDSSAIFKVSILINEKNEIIYNSKIVDCDVLKKELYIFIEKNQANHMIFYSAEREAMYRFFIKVQNDIFDVYTKIREDKSQTLFKKSFYILTDIEKETILKLYPLNIK